jgi:hypothetical protein
LFHFRPQGVHPPVGSAARGRLSRQAEPTSAVIAGVVYQAANSPDMLPRKELPKARE